MADVIVVTDVGLGIITNRIKGAGTEPNYIHWGTGGTAAVVANTALQTPRAESRVAGASTLQTTTTADDTYQVIGTLTCAGTAAAIVEAGLFDAVTVGNCFVRGTFDVINLNVGDSIQFTIKVILDQA